MAATTCPTCHAESPLRAVYAAARYEGGAKDIVWKLKFGRARAAAGEMGEILAIRMARHDMRGCVVTHVPTVSARARQHGYDQAALVAKAFAAKMQLPYIPLLARTGKHKQVGASKAVRAQQLSGDFHAIRRRRIAGARILLVDDVITTGATLEACAHELLRAGAARMDGAVFAQA
jgi:predicted amidophosphoribosyltransferase